MIIGLIPNLLAPLFALQKERKKKIKIKKKEKRKIENKKEKGKKKKGSFWCYGLSRGPRSVSLPKGLALAASPRGFVGTREGLARGLAAAVAMVMEEQAETAQTCHRLPGRYLGQMPRRLDLCHWLLPGSSAALPAVWRWLGTGGYLVQAAVQKLPPFEGGGMFVLLSLTWLC